jgi:hypothetical protein
MSAFFFGGAGVAGVRTVMPYTARTGTASGFQALPGAARNFQKKL